MYIGTPQFVLFESSNKFPQDVYTILEKMVSVSPESIFLHQSRCCYSICKDALCYYCQISVADESLNQLRERLFDITVPLAAG